MATEARNDELEEQIDESRKLAAKWKDAKLLEAAVRLMKSVKVLRCHSTDFNQNAHLVTFQNCVVNLRTREVLPHKREYMLTQLVPHKYNLAAPFPELWNKQLERFCCRDLVVVGFLKKYFGRCLSGDTYQAMLFLVGNGENGKGTLLNILRGCLGGDMTRSIMKDFLLRKKDFQGGPNSELSFVQDGKQCIQRFACYSRTDRATYQSHLPMDQRCSIGASTDREFANARQSSAQTRAFLRREGVGDLRYFAFGLQTR